MTIKELHSYLRRLQKEQAALKSEGNIICSGWIDTVIKSGKTYYRLRTHRGKGLTPGCKALKTEDVEETQKAIERGKRLMTIESQIEQCRSELERKKAQLKRLVG